VLLAVSTLPHFGQSLQRAFLEQQANDITINASSIAIEHFFTR
jgi:hypothetical protein